MTLLQNKTRSEQSPKQFHDHRGGQSARKPYRVPQTSLLSRTRTVIMPDSPATIIRKLDSLSPTTKSREERHVSTC